VFTDKANILSGSFFQSNRSIFDPCQRVTTRCTQFFLTEKFSRSHPRFVGAMKLLPSPPETWTREYKVYFSRRFLATPLLAKILTEEICGKKRIIVEGAEKEVKFPMYQLITFEGVYVMNSKS
jgi:hypothetical protein